MAGNNGNGNGPGMGLHILGVGANLLLWGSLGRMVGVPFYVGATVAGGAMVGLSMEKLPEFLDKPAAVIVAPGSLLVGAVSDIEHDYKSLGAPA